MDFLRQMPKYISQSKKTIKSNNKSPLVKTRKTIAKETANVGYTMPNINDLNNYTMDVAPIVNTLDGKYNDEYNNATCKRTNNGVSLKSQQIFVSKYINLYTPYRGIVLWHGLGSGKTLSAISVAEQFISDQKHDKKYKVLFISPAMLVSNFETEIQKYDEFYKYNEIYGENYTHFTSNGKLTTYSESQNRGLFKNKVIIIDESQLLISSITRALLNKDKNINNNLVSAYTQMLRETALKIVCLSGTPIDITPAELAVLFNLLAGTPMYYILDNVNSTNIEDEDFAKSIQFQYTANGNALIYRNPVFFHNNSENKLVYTPTGNAYSNEQFLEKIKQQFPDATVTIKYKDPLFNVESFIEEHGIIYPKQEYSYNVAVDTTKIRENHIKRGLTPRTYEVKNAEIFQKKVAGYMSYFDNIQSIIPKVKILNEATTNYNSNKYRIGYDNSDRELFTVQLCNYSPYQQEMIDYLSSSVFNDNLMAVDLYGFMKRNCEHFVYPFISVDDFKANYVNSIEYNIKFGIKKMYHSGDLTIEALSEKEAIHKLFLRLMFVYNMYPKLEEISDAESFFQKYVESRNKKSEAFIQFAQKYVSSDFSSSSSGGAGKAKTQYTKKLPKKATRKIIKNPKPKQQHGIHDLIEFQNVNDANLIYNYYKKYVKILSDVLLCTFPVYSVWSTPNIELKTPECFESEYDANPLDYCAEHLHISNLQKYSSKMYEIVQRILDNPDACHIIYSQFKQVNIPLARALMANGYEQFKIKIDSKNYGKNKKIVADGTYNKSKRHFMYITGTGGSDNVVDEDAKFYNQIWGPNYDEGQLDSKLKQHYINIFNENVDDDIYSVIRRQVGINNERGQICNVVILNSAAAEGITLKTVRYVHLLHPPASMAKIYQIIGRAVRNCTHEKLNEEERNVTPILYLSASSNGTTSDQDKYNECVNVADAYVPYLKLLKQTSVDCKLNEQIEYHGEPVHQNLQNNCVISI
jgi:hypothetical protein